MHTAAKKLKSQRGASLIFALLVFMLCAFAGAAAVVTAAANAGRYARLESDQQQYLSASSAARLLRDELRGKTVTVTLRMRHTDIWWYMDIEETFAAGTPETVHYRYDYDQYEFIDATGSPQNNPMDACEVEIENADHTPLASGSVVYALKDFLEPYFKSSLLQNAAPAYFFGNENKLSSENSKGQSHSYAGTGGTVARPAPLDAGSRRLVITGATSTGSGGTGNWTDWHDTLGTVYAVMSGIGDYGLRAEVSMQPTGAKADDAALYTTAFELPAQVKRDITTDVTRQDDLSGSPDTLVPADADGRPADLDDVKSYGRMTTVNTVTVTVSWGDTTPVVTRVY